MPFNNNKTFQLAVTTAGTPEQLAANPVSKHETVLLTCDPDNATSCFYGYSSVQADKDNNNHIELLPGDVSDAIHVSNTNRIWVDVDTNGERIQIQVA